MPEDRQGPASASAGTGGLAGAGATGAGGAGGSAGTGGASQGGSAGSSGGSAGGNGAAGGSAGAGGCPGSAGPTMVNVGSFCIDSTEVTNAQYAQFLSASVTPQSVTGNPSQCAFNASYVPSSDWPATGKDDVPVVYVDWCDALAFCSWAGKRLCGRIGGGANDYNEHDVAFVSQWYHACSANGTLVYPYGNTYSATPAMGSTTAPGLRSRPSKPRAARAVRRACST